MSRQQAARSEVELPDFDSFWRQGYAETAVPEEDFVAFEQFRRDPDANPLQTPSGRIELYSQTIASYDYADCPPHPAWLEPTEWLGGERAQSYRLHLISNQPAGKLHSQMDEAPVSQASKADGREPALMHPRDAAARGIADGDVVKVFNDRGALLAVAQLSEGIRPGVVRVATGSWYDPEDYAAPGAMDKHGNPNVLTPDRGTSSLGQGPIAHSALVEVERFEGEVPAVSAYALPRFEARNG